MVSDDDNVENVEWVIIIMEPLFFSVCPAGKCTGRRSIFCQNILILIMMTWMMVTMMMIMMINYYDDADDDNGQSLLHSKIMMMHSRKQSSKGRFETSFKCFSGLKI